MPLIPGGQISAAALGLPAREDARWGAHYCCTWDFYSEAAIMLDAIKQAGQRRPDCSQSKNRPARSQFKYAAINSGIATFGSAASDAVFGASVGAHQVTNSWAIDVVKNGADTIGTIINPK